MPDRTSTIHVNDTRTVETGDDTIVVQQANRSITVKQNITTESRTEPCAFFDVAW